MKLKTKLNAVANKLIKTVIRFEKGYAFIPSWFSILINPFFITRRQLYYSVQYFASLVSRRAKILDVGCGMKPYKDLFPDQKYLGIEVTGGGHSDKAKNADKFFDGNKIPFHRKQFDVVICTEVLEHTINPDILIKEIYRVIKKNGKVLIC